MIGRVEKTTSMSANVRVSTKETFSDFCKEQDWIQANLLGAILDWYMGLDPTTRLLVADKLDQRDKAAVARLVLERMAREGDKGRDDEAGGSTADLPGGGPNSSGGASEEDRQVDEMMDAANESHERPSAPKRRSKAS